MSEYQYYEFLAIDRPLTKQEMAELRAISSRATITPSRFMNVYNWGDLKARPAALLEKYFDGFVYEANWGTHELMFRLPKRLIDPETADLYCACDNASSQVKGDYVILEFISREEEGGRWIEAEDSEEWLPSLLPLRADLLNGDLRSLYLAWLLCAQTELPDEEVEPPVPPGLGNLTASLEAFAKFLRIDKDLISVAAERSFAFEEACPVVSEFEEWIEALQESEKTALLLQFVRGDNPHLRTELMQRFRQSRSAGRHEEETKDEQRRTVGELMAAAEEHAEKRKREEACKKAEEEARRAREEAAARAKYLDGITGRDEDLWRQVETLVEAKKAGEYDLAVRLLKDLRDLSTRSGKVDTFKVRLGQLRDRHAKKLTFIKRLDKAELT